MQSNTISVSPIPLGTTVQKIRSTFQAFSVKNVYIEFPIAYVEFRDQGDLCNLDIQFDNYEVADLNNAKIDLASPQQLKKYTQQNVSQNQRSESVWKVKFEQAEKEIFQKCQQILSLEQNLLALEQNQIKRKSQELEKYSKFLDKCSQAYSAQNIKLQKQNQSYKQREKQYQKQNQSYKEQEKQYQKRIADLEETLEKLLIEEKTQKKSELKEVQLYDVLLAKGISDITVQILKSQEIHTLEELKELKQEDLRALGLKLGEIVRIRKLQ